MFCRALLWWALCFLLFQASKSWRADTGSTQSERCEVGARAYWERKWRCEVSPHSGSWSCRLVRGHGVAATVG